MKGNDPNRFHCRTTLKGLVLIVAGWLGAHVPLVLNQWLGARLGRLAEVTNSKRSRVAEANIGACFPHLSPDERQTLRRQVLMHNGRFVCELPAAWFRSRDYWAKRLDTSAFDSLALELLARGKGLIIALPHLGNWELGSHGFRAVGELTALYRPPREPALEPLLRKGRERNNVNMVPTDRPGLRKICKTLRAGRAVVVLPDQAPAGGHAGAVHAPFFGLPALTMTLLSQLARRCDSPVLFSYFERRPAGRFTIRCFEADSAIASEDPLEAATALNRGLEQCVRKCPDQYQWTYRRFKHPPAGETSIYDAGRKNEPAGEPRTAREAHHESPVADLPPEASPMTNAKAE